MVQVKAWCCKATNHYLSQCGPRSMSLNGITRPQWVNTGRSEQNDRHNSWWRHQMETFSALLAPCAGNSPVTRSFDVFFDLCLNKQLSKQSWGWWFETQSHHYDVIVMLRHHFHVHVLFNAFWFKFHWCLLLRGPVEHKSTLTQEMAWCQTGDKPLSKPMKTKDSDAISLGHNELTHGGHKKHGRHLQTDISNLFLGRKKNHFD